MSCLPWFRTLIVIRPRATSTTQQYNRCYVPTKGTGALRYPLTLTHCDVLEERALFPFPRTFRGESLMWLVPLGLLWRSQQAIMTSEVMPPSPSIYDESPHRCNRANSGIVGQTTPSIVERQAFKMLIFLRKTDGIELLASCRPAGPCICTLVFSFQVRVHGYAAVGLHDVRGLMTGAFHSRL